MEKSIIEMMKSQVYFKTNLSEVSLDRDLSFLIFDRDLPKYSLAFGSWKNSFRHQYGVKAGEQLKDLRHFESHIRKIMKRLGNVDTRRMQFVIVGGGSVGDFGGFIASIFKRGVGLVHIPSTWLAAIDSSHGGKTALNVAATKNQIGCFYPAQKIYVVEQLLLSQTPKRAIDACGELLKIALIDNAYWTKNLSSIASPGTALKKNLRAAIAAKYKIIKRDPLEKSGIRQILNLGHTWGHVLESELKWPHGTAVLAGLHFCLEWSYNKKLLAEGDYQRAKIMLNIIKAPKITKLSKPKALTLLLRDKKRDGPQSLTFIFLKGLGKPTRLKVSANDILREADRQGWLRR